MQGVGQPTYFSGKPEPQALKVAGKVGRLCCWKPSQSLPEDPILPGFLCYCHQSLPMLALSLDIGYDTRHRVGSPVLEAPGNWMLLVQKEPCSLPAFQYDSYRCCSLESLCVQGVGMRYRASQEGEVHPPSAGWAKTVP